eukprot:scaffold54793_cov43-Phaeocystis_antarctica.AAC.1
MPLVLSSIEFRGERLVADGGAPLFIPRNECLWTLCLGGERGRRRPFLLPPRARRPETGALKLGKQNSGQRGGVRMLCLVTSIFEPNLRTRASGWRAAASRRGPTRPEAHLPAAVAAAA